ncbi:5966_t:CDS:2, partial [Funneliformis geosporum]
PKDDKFIPAFYSVLQNTLVAENLQQANRIAFGKTRCVVTLMVLKDAMNSIFSSDITPETIAKLEREQSQIQEKKDELPKLEFELSKLEMYADACVKVLPIMKQEWSSYDQEDESVHLFKFRTPLSPTSKTSKSSSAHSNIGTDNDFGEGVASRFSGTEINAGPRSGRPSNIKWLPVQHSCFWIVINSVYPFGGTTSMQNIPFDRYQFGASNRAPKKYDAPTDNTTSQHANPDTFIRQPQSYMACWPTTAAEQPTPLSQLGVHRIGSTSSRVPHSDEIRFFSMRKKQYWITTIITY